MVGTFQVGNLLTAIETVKELREKGFTISDEAIEKGIYSFTIPARTEKISEKPLVILDGGHNEASVAVLTDTVKKYLKDKKETFLLSFMKDKDYEESISLIAPLCENIVFTQTDSLRGETPEVLAGIAKKYCNNVFVAENVSEGLSLATEKAKNDVLIVAGSFYLVSEVRKKLL